MNTTDWLNALDDDFKVKIRRTIAIEMGGFGRGKVVRFGVGCGVYFGGLKGDQMVDAIIKPLHAIFGEVKISVKCSG